MSSVKTYTPPRRPRYRATRDVDAAVRVSDGKQYEQIASILTNGGRFRRLHADGTEFMHATGVQFDLLPFGDITDAEDVLR
jgi:predicted nucleotidyltransferase